VGAPRPGGVLAGVNHGGRETTSTATACRFASVACRFAFPLPVLDLYNRGSTTGEVVMSSWLSIAGRRLLDRRHFLAHLGGGLSSVALLHLLAEDGLAADRKPLRPAIRPQAPLAARAPHFQARAKRVVHIFCSGACSHLDTFDYKPELIRRDGQEMPGVK